LARKILLADDSVTAQNMGRRILADAGYEVITVNNGSAALKKIAEQKPDLVVLDVYMPGYGGLEVCQRVKESRETARIPVLLTVGKLEPFKPDEAKRVQADAFVVKPFEASELLTALTKLEDKIVPEARRPKGRFAKALTESGGEERFGDKESGWKNRLNIPAPGAKLEEPREQTPTAPGTAPEQSGRDDDGRKPEPSETPESPIPAGLPADITAEEIEAIRAAAATMVRTVEESTGDTKLDDAVAPTEENSPEAALASFASTAQTSGESTGFVSETTASAEVYEETSGEAASTPTASMEADAATQAHEVSSEKKQVPDDQDVMAAIASLTPANGEGATISAAPAISSGPRWVAEPAALSAEDSTYVLEHEMEKAYAAIAAAEAGRAAAMALTAEVASESGPAAVIGSIASPDAAEEAVAAVPPTMERNEETAYAAAASASGAVSQTVSDTSVAPKAPEMAEGEKHREAELAAAWQNWKQIRESIVGSEMTAQIADVAAAELKAADQPQDSVPSTQVQPTSEASADQSSSDSSAESAAIASIVDSVLAELKPKLVEEIARKMSREKKKK
jgi:CheY-like chemotaxis protein